MRIMVVGGAGYIGSHMCRMLARSGHQVVAYDDLSTGHRAALDGAQLLHCSLSDAAALDRAFSGPHIDAVMHFAAKSIVDKSVANPLDCYIGNVSGTLNLLDCMLRHRVRSLIFSSSASVYGEPKQARIAEDHPIAPISPYGHSKAMIEQVLSDLAAAGRIDAVALRYFNAAGADPGGDIGESHAEESHLIPRILRMAAGEPLQVTIFGRDYDTPDGTCVRDYIHVNDLCDGHLRALQHLASNPGFHAYNLGNSRGHSVAEILRTCEEVVGRPLPVRHAGRRQGDPAQLVADSGKARRELDWKPLTSDIAQIVRSAWQWHRSPAF
jgi:UDP-glucose 4-epimerase